jgi:hypothetical protein
MAESFKVKSDRERLIAYSAGILGSTLSNPGNIYSPEALIKRSIRAANKLITTVYDDAKLAEILKGDE